MYEIQSINIPPTRPPPLLTTSTVRARMRRMDDVWSDIGSLPSPTPNHFQNFLSPAADTTTPFLPPPPSLLTTHEDPPPKYTEKFRRLMKNRESAARSRARKQARADELEHEVRRLAKENAKLKRLQKQVPVSQVPKESRLHRTKSAPF